MSDLRSRFSSSSARAGSAPAAPVAAAPLPSAGDLAQRKAALQTQAQRLNQTRLRLEAEYNQAERELRAIEREAQALGVTTLEEFQALIAATEAKDAEELARYAQELEAEADLQAAVEAKLQAMDSAA